MCYSGDPRNPRFPLKGFFKGDIDIGIDVDVDVDVDTDVDVDIDIDLDAPWGLSKSA